MTTLDIRIRVNTLSDYSEYLKRKSGEKTLLLIVKAFAEYIRILYISLIEEEMNSRKYRGKWEPVDDEGYLEYLGVTPVKDILPLIEEALIVKKVGHTFYVQFDTHYEYPESGIPLITVLKSIEYGTSKFNARPIFRKNVNLINKNMTTLWRGFLKKRGAV